jgi:hypothetical protein
MFSDRRLSTGNYCELMSKLWWQWQVVINWRAAAGQRFQDLDALLNEC